MTAQPKNETRTELQSRIKTGLAKCTQEQREMFVRMYGPKECLTDKFMFNVTQLAKYHVNDIVDKINSRSDLNWMNIQVQRTLLREKS